jgi:HEAT repeat protein
MEPLVAALIVASLVGGIAHWLNKLERGRQTEEPSKGGPVTSGPVQTDPRSGTVTCNLGHELSLRREDAETDALKLVGVKEIEIGDPVFDSEFYLEGPPALVLALFDAETRRLVRELSHVEIVAGRFQARPSERSARRSGSATEAIANLVDRLMPPADFVPRLVDNARHDPEPGVRLQALLILEREYPRLQETRETLHAALADADDEIRLRAAMALGSEGHDVLLEIVSREGADDSCVARAISALGKHFPAERAKEILEQALKNGNVTKACACIEALGRNGTAEAVETLAQVMLAAGANSGAAAARALGETGQASAEAPLLEALKLDPEDLREAAAGALGRVGSVRSVPALQEAGEGHSATRDLRRMARQAIAEIQSRLAGASPGQLSLAEGSAGQLSMTQGEAGRLSVSSEKPV